MSPAPPPFAPPRTIVLVDKSERQYVEKLTAILPVHGVLQHPVSERDIEPLLESA